MTFKEKLSMEHPERLNNDCNGGCEGCPKDYGYEKAMACSGNSLRCGECWNREIPGFKPVKVEGSFERKPCVTDMVNHPPHYKSETGLETIDVIEAFTFDLKGIEATDTGNILKYMCRWKGKNGLQDLEKAKWYLEHLIAHVKKLEEENKPVINEKEEI